MMMVTYCPNTQSLDAIQCIAQMRALYDKYTDQLHTERAAKRLINTVDLLFERAIVAVRQIEAALDVPYRSASRYVEKFVQLGILREITGQARNRIFRADEIFLILEGSV